MCVKSWSGRLKWPRKSDSRLSAEEEEDWAYQRGVVLDVSRPGEPTDNTFSENFNGKFHAEYLNAHWFTSLYSAQSKMEKWSRDFNVVRPHCAIWNNLPILLMNGSEERKAL